jgi:C4-dicarboxylate-specific signal transduction histidine kinase
MAAMHVSAIVTYDGWIVLASFLIAVVVSTSAMIATLKRRSLVMRISGAIVLGLAIFSMHFTAMAAASFEPLDNPHVGEDSLDQFSLALWVGTTTLLLLFLALVSAMFDRQVEADRVERLRKRLHHASHLNAMGMMASTLAHELNQPLAAAANYLVGTRRLISEKPSDMATLEFGLSEAEQQIRRAGEIIKRARGLISQTEIRREMVSLEILVEHSIGLCRGNDECGETEIKLDLDPEVDLLLVDPVQTEQVLVNLIRNACGAMRDSPSPKLAISSRPHGSDFAEIILSDVGPGFAAHPDDLFAAFAESTGEGLGVGLSISRTIVEAHGGRIWAENNKGRGATFHFTMPIASQAAFDRDPELGG